MAVPGQSDRGSSGFDTRSPVAIQGATGHGDSTSHDRPALQAEPKLHNYQNGSASVVTEVETPGVRLLRHEIDFLRAALDGLTGRERQVVFAICEGGTNELIAERLAIALPTLRTHLMRLNQKLGTTSKGDVVRYVAATLLSGYRSARIAPAGV